MIEWEGHAADHKPGWMHPAVFVLTAGCYSYDMEVRRLGTGSTSQQQLWTAAADAGRWLGKALQWLQAKWASSS